MTTRELNDWTAEHVMGWSRGDKIGVAFWYDKHVNVASLYTCWNPVEDANDRDKLVEKLEAYGYEVGLTWDRFYGFECELEARINGQQSALVQDKTSMGRAVCLAAKAAKESEQCTTGSTD